MGFYINVRNRAMNQHIWFEKLEVGSISEAIEYRDQLRKEYGYNDIKLLLEVKPDPEEDEDIYNDEEILGGVEQE